MVRERCFNMRGKWIRSNNRGEQAQSVDLTPHVMHDGGKIGGKCISRIKSIQ